MRLRKIVLSIAVLTVSTLGVVSLASPAYAQDFNHDACQGVDAVAGGNCANGGKTATNQLNNVIKVALEILSIIAGTAAVFMIVVSGFRFITSNGDSSSVASARSGLIWAVVGLVIVAVAQFIIHYVLNAVNNGKL